MGKTQNLQTAEIIQQGSPSGAVVDLSNSEEDSNDENDENDNAPTTQLPPASQGTSLVLDMPFGENENRDISGRGHDAIVRGAKYDPSGGRDGTGAYIFSENAYLEIADADDLSASTTGELTVSFWVRFDSTEFVGEGSQNDYIHFLGKGGNSGDYEYMFRQYNSSNAQDRNDRVSFYHFNPEGGLGAGSYVQQSISPGEWIHLVGVIRQGTMVEIWKNGVMIDSDPLSSYNIDLQNGNAPLRIGTADTDSYLQGSIDDLKIYSKALSAAEIKELAK